MNDIQKARDVLAKWRTDAVPGPWGSDADSYIVEASAEWGARFGDLGGSAESISLIVGTAGNPELLDAIDGFLERVTVNLRENWAEMYAERIAAAIIAADNRMRS